tara:strand:+ start:261 stop:554 length:294 start_codon:yes stop_codon:yes gene_type:complete
LKGLIEMILPNKTNERPTKGGDMMAITQINMACSQCIDKAFNLGKTTMVKDFLDINNCNFIVGRPTHMIIDYPTIYLCDECLVEYKRTMAFFKAYVV